MGRNKDLECPYCGADIEIVNDDGFGLNESEIHEYTCDDCDKTFVFTTSISINYTAHKADCLNGAPHNYKATHTHPVRYTVMRCTECGDERPCTDEEMLEVISSKKTIA